MSFPRYLLKKAQKQFQKNSPHQACLPEYSLAYVLFINCRDINFPQNNNSKNEFPTLSGKKGQTTVLKKS